MEWHSYAPINGNGWLRLRADPVLPECEIFGPDDDGNWQVVITLGRKDSLSVVRSARCPSLDDAKREAIRMVATYATELLCATEKLLLREAVDNP